MTDYTHCDVLLYPKEHAIDSVLLHADVEFGVLQSNGDCVNIGICRINTTHYANMAFARKKHRLCPSAEAFLRASPEGRLQAFFPRAGMLACTERAFFSKPVFPVPVAYFLPEPVQNDLPGLTQDIIAAGLYPIRRSDEGFWIDF